MKYVDEILELIKNNSILLTRDLKKSGIPRTYLAILEKRGEIEKVSHGVYISKDSFEDEMHYIQ
ncbi:MAG: type IV toxin-antitoxin system AbiEi family antitoxin domain-containing protein, partial [bacterium]|nr:type IV toxin-antitoxin system AbiEi family antitoxin domain-containing protein [bacterium]